MSFHQKELSRRAKYTPQQVEIACCSAYKLPNGAWQADQNITACEALARQLGTYLVRDAMKPEDFFNMVPQNERHISDCPVKDGDLVCIGSRKLGLVSFVFWECPSCGALYPESNPTFKGPSCNGKPISKCLCKSKEAGV